MKHSAPTVAQKKHRSKCIFKYRTAVSNTYHVYRGFFVIRIFYLYNWHSPIILKGCFRVCEGPYHMSFHLLNPLPAFGWKTLNYKRAGWFRQNGNGIKLLGVPGGRGKSLRQHCKSLPNMLIRWVRILERENVNRSE